MRDLHLDCRSLTKREEKLRSYGYWKEVAGTYSAALALQMQSLHPSPAYSVAMCSTYCVQCCCMLHIRLLLTVALHALMTWHNTDVALCHQLACSTSIVEVSMHSYPER